MDFLEEDIHLVSNMKNLDIEELLMETNKSFCEEWDQHQCLMLFFNMTDLSNLLEEEKKKWCTKSGKSYIMLHSYCNFLDQLIESWYQGSYKVKNTWEEFEKYVLSPYDIASVFRTKDGLKHENQENKKKAIKLIYSIKEIICGF